jgi:hypothetical protein
MAKSQKIDIIPGMCFYIPLNELRKTPKVDFHSIPCLLEDGISMIQRVVHGVGAQSPSIVGRDDLLPWYMHEHQEDNLLVLGGERVIDLYTQEHGKVETFRVTADKIEHNGEVIFEGPFVFGWPTRVFHRPNSPEGSIALFFVKHTEGFDLNTEFNIYDLDVASGEYSVLREGHLDQPNDQMAE